MKNSQLKFKADLDRSAKEVDEDWYMRTLMPLIRERKKVAEYILRSGRLDLESKKLYEYYNKIIKEVVNI